jgi:hypothetical protein
MFRAGALAAQVRVSRPLWATSEPRLLSGTTPVGRVALEMFRLRLEEYPDRLMALQVVEGECR